MKFTTTKFGHDISTWNDAPYIDSTVDFQKMKASGAEFVILRASQGAVKDTDFDIFKNNSRGILPRGVYHYWNNTIPPKQQADILLSAIGDEKFEGRVWLDLEHIAKGAYNKPKHWKEFMRSLEGYGYRTGIYTGYYYWKDNAVKTKEYLAYFYEHPLWQAWYNPDPANVKIAGRWRDMMMWQSSAKGDGFAAGTEGNDIDVNCWNDDYDFVAEWGG